LLKTIMSEPRANPDPLGQPQALADLLLYRLSVITRNGGLPMVRLFEGSSRWDPPSRRKV